MEEELSNLNEEEQLKAENDFLKMKLMLEHGGQFSHNENEEMTLPPEIENQFLNNILAFEKQYQQHKLIKVFDKVGRPRHFKPVREIAEADINQAWDDLKNYLTEHGVVLSACSPSVTARELYRFATEELFECETDDINLPGWSTNFIYDEFYPDSVYDNSRLVEDDLFIELFRKRDLFSEMHYASEGFIFNGKEYDSFKTFSDKINSFHSLFDDIQLNEFDITNCNVNKNESVVEGRYRATASMNVNEINFSGEFSVKLITGELGYWYMKDIQIEGFNP